MAHAELCPVCYGKGGLVNRHGAPVVDDCGQVKCHGCGGRGWVTVQDRPTTICWRPRQPGDGPLIAPPQSNERAYYNC